MGHRAPAEDRRVTAKRWNFRIIDGHSMQAVPDSQLRRFGNRGLIDAAYGCFDNVCVRWSTGFSLLSFLYTA